MGAALVPRAPAGVTVGAGVGVTVGAVDGGQVPWMTPHDVDAHGVPSKAGVETPSCDRAVSETSSSTHQPRSWSKAEAPLNIAPILVTLSRLHLPSG